MMIHRSIARYAMALVGAGALLAVGLSGMASAATIPMSVKVEQPVPALTESTEFGTASSGWATSSFGPTAGTQTSLTFPAASITSSAGSTVAASDWVGLSVSVSNATSSTDWEVYGSSTALTNSTDSSDTIPASDILVPSSVSGDGGGSMMSGSGSGGWSASVPSGSPSTGALSGTSTVEYSGISAENTDFIGIQPEITIPAGQAVGTYSGTLTLSAAIQ